ncbi:MAG: aminopeptidase P family protein [Bacteroidia bacterium]|nr:aminopeptidase P family protein [Bacteroidia bacterium]MDW8333211.1 aminopeptidase P family protein [Bacteroidia bacterium]
MRYETLPAEVFVRNREKTLARLAPGAAALFFAQEPLCVNGDAHYAFSQDANFFYLTGIDQPENALFLFPDAPLLEWREVLFIKRSNEQIRTWEGWKYSVEEARAVSGVLNVRYTDELEDFLTSVAGYVSAMYFDFNEHDRNRALDRKPARRWLEWFRGRFPAHEIRRAYPIVSELRQVKQKEEIEQIKRAIARTHAAFLRLARFVRPGVMEYEVEAEIIHEFIRTGADGHAFHPIVASGARACVLHYEINDQPLREGELLLVDFGCRYGNYNADLTRCLPVGGKFSERQKQVYNAVLRVQRAAARLYQPGALLEEINAEVVRLISDELVGLGLLTPEEIERDPKAYFKYYPHRVGHHLGLVTHDDGSRYRPLAPGMVLTCEPGIYIEAEGIGVRLENDILVTETGPEDLMAEIPIEIEDVEALMRSGT